MLNTLASLIAFDKIMCSIKKQKVLIQLGLYKVSSIWTFQSKIKTIQIKKTVFCILIQRQTTVGFVFAPAFGSENDLENENSEKGLNTFWPCLKFIITIVRKFVLYPASLDRIYYFLWHVKMAVNKIAKHFLNYNGATFDRKEVFDFPSKRSKIRPRSDISNTSSKPCGVRSFFEFKTLLRKNSPSIKITAPGRHRGY